MIVRELKIERGKSVSAVANASVRFADVIFCCVIESSVLLVSLRAREFRSVRATVSDVVKLSERSALSSNGTRALLENKSNMALQETRTDESAT